MGDVLAVLEPRGGRIRGGSLEVLSAAAETARGLGGEAHALVMAGEGGVEGLEELGRFGASRILLALAEPLAHYHPEGYARVVVHAVGQGSYQAVLFPATSQGKDLAPRVAALLDVPLASDVTGIEVEDGGLVVRRPVFSGKLVATVGFLASPALLSLRPNVFPPKEFGASGEVQALEVPGLDPAGWAIRRKGFEASPGTSKDVAEASIVVSGGRGMKGPENWHLLEDLRQALGEEAALGASRAVVDAGWRPHHEQVGQTGKTVAPKLYFALGISGAIQHLAGMRTSQVIVAVNKDPEAPIFQVANYGIVGDVLEVVPRLAEEIRKLKASD